MTSFFSERTAEYALVPMLHEYLRSRYSNVSPIFFWKTREENSSAEKLHDSYWVKILAMFAKRPKVFGLQNVVRGKVNAELITYAKTAMRVGIPTILGFPAVQSVFDLYKKPHMYWLNLNSLMDGDFYFTVNLAKDIPIPVDENNKVVPTVTLTEIADLIDVNSDTLRWSDAMVHLSELRAIQHKTEISSPFAWFGGYKPVYFLISQDV